MQAIENICILGTGRQTKVGEPGEGDVAPASLAGTKHTHRVRMFVMGHNVLSSSFTPSPTLYLASTTYNLPLLLLWRVNLRRQRGHIYVSY